MKRTQRLSAKARRFEESVIRGMTRLCDAAGGINLAQGFPGGQPPEEVIAQAVEALRGGYNQYANTWGAPVFLEAIARKLRDQNGIDADPETMITVTCGTTEAMIATLLAVIDPGDEVVILEPFYENYGPDTVISGAVPRYVELDERDFSLDPERLRRAFSPRTRAIILNTPHNPTGRVFNREELEAIASLCIEFDCLAVTDEIYEHITYEGHEHISIATLEGMAERTVTIGGLSKTYSVTGWRLGYAAAPPDLTQGIRKMHDFLTVGAPHPLQIAGARALGMGDEFYRELKRSYARKRALLLEALGRAGLEPFPPEGSYFVLCRIPEDWKGDDTAFARHLLEKRGVAGVPGSSFYSDPERGRRRIRFHFAADEGVLEEAARRLTA